MTAGLAIAEILESVYASERDSTEAVVYRYASHSEADELNKTCILVITTIKTVILTMISMCITAHWICLI